VRQSSGAFEDAAGRMRCLPPGIAVVTFRHARTPAAKRKGKRNFYEQRQFDIAQIN
jgi:hypothetical protein